MSPEKVPAPPEPQADSSFVGNEDFIPFGNIDTEDKSPAETATEQKKRKLSLSENENLVTLYQKPYLSDTLPAKQILTENDNDSYIYQSFISIMRTDTPWLNSMPEIVASHSDLGASHLPNSILTPHVYNSLIPIRQLNEEIKAFALYISPTNQERVARSACIERIANCLKTIWPSANVSSFGSYYTELYLPSSDLDIVCVNKDCPATVLNLKKAAKSLLRHNLVELGTLKIISKARIPLVKFVERHTHFTVDISFNQASGIDGSDNIRNLIKKWPAMRPLLLVLKQFLLNRSLNEVYMGGLGSYALTLMLTSFFQLHPMIQSKWICPEDNLGVLLIEFCELYGKHLNYENVGVSILDRGGYYKKEDRSWDNYRKPNLLSVEDPYNPQNDVTKGSFAVHQVRMAFQHVYELLSAMVIAMTKYQNRHKESFQGSSDSKIHSYLSSIIFVDEEILTHRLFIEQLGGGTI